MKDDSGENVEYAIKLQGGVMVPVDSHFPVEKFNAIQDAFCLLYTSPSPRDQA